ncbi:MAG: PTS sugar transporter subunit IIA [Micavibrio sp.]
MPSRNPHSIPSCSFDIVAAALNATHAKHMMKLAAQILSEKIGIHERILLEKLNAKEHAPSTDKGVAILHMHISGLKQPTNIFLRVKNPVDMGAADNQPVDMLCILLTPERDGVAYLRSLARISRFFQRGDILARLRAAEDEKAMRAILEDSALQQLAA